MTDQMFCFQCEQTAKCEACTGRAGVCGKTEDVAAAQDELTGALIGLARTCEGAGKIGARTYELVVDGLFTCVTNVNFNEFSIRALIAEVHAEAAAVAAAAGCDAQPDYDMVNMWSADEDIRSLKSLVLFGIRGTAAYADHPRVSGRPDETHQALSVSSCLPGARAWSG